MCDERNIGMSGKGVHVAAAVKMIAYLVVTSDHTSEQEGFESGIFMALRRKRQSSS